jgi:hypothetical protein
LAAEYSAKARLRHAARLFILSAILVLAACLWGSPAAARQQDAASPASERFVLCDAYCAIVDGTGARVVDRVFETLHDFIGPVAVYGYHGKSGAIDRQGRTIVKPVYDRIFVLGERFLLAENGPAGDGGAVTLFDERGNPLLHKVGDVRVDVWGGHPFYRADCPASDECPAVFLDDHGRETARFAVVREMDGASLIVASADGTHFGYIDQSLRFVIPPRHLDARPFVQDVALIRTEAGPGLIDRHGRIIVDPGHYESLFVDDRSPWIEAFRPGDHNCSDALRLDGKRVRLARGLCPFAKDDMKALGYAFVRDKARRLGIVDARGRTLIRPAYPWLRGLNDRYLIFGNDASQPTAFGIVDRRGKIVLALQPVRIEDYSAGCCSNPGELRDALVGVTPEGTGLLGLDGRWIVPARYKDARVISSDLVALRDTDDVYRFFTAAGQPTGLTSATEPAWLLPPPGGVRTFFSFGQRAGGSEAPLLKGVADRTGRIILPAEYTDIENAGTDLWLVKKQQGASVEIGLADHSGKIVAEPRFSELVPPYRRGAAILRDQDGDAVLVDDSGRTLASFAALFPQLATRGDGDDTIDLSLDICFDPDPAAEPGERSPRRSSAQRICADAALRQQSRATEKNWLAAQAGDCLPDDFLALRPAYDKSLADCANDACFRTAMQAFRQSIAAKARHCTAMPRGFTVLRKPVPAAVRARLTRRIATDYADDFDAGTKAPLHFWTARLSGRDAILVSAETGATNGPMWLFRNDDRSWNMLLYGYAGYLRPLEATDGVRNGLPVLRTQQHVSCCEHEVTYYAYNGRTYKPTRVCNQRYDADEMPLLFCQQDLDTPKEEKK